MDRPEDTDINDSDRLRRRVSELEALLAAMSPEEYLHSIFDNMFEGIQILDSDLRYVYLNTTAAAHGRRTREELLGTRMTDAYPGIEATALYRLMTRCIQDRKPQQMINRFTYPDGHTAWFDLRISPIPIGILILSVDISTQKTIEEHLRQSQDNLMVTLACIAEGVMTTDVQGRITQMNPAAEALTGWLETDSRGHQLDDLVQFFDQRSGNVIAHPINKILNEGPKIGLAHETQLLTKDGSRIPVACSGAPIRDSDGAVRGVVLVIRDMNEECALTEMLYHAQKMEAIGRLAGSVAHDFNNLLTIISSYSTMVLSRMADDDPSRDDIREIQLAGERATSLTRQLLTFSRKQTLYPVVLDLNTIIAEMDKLLRRLIGKDIDLTTNLTPDLKPVECDPGKIEQIVMNLAVNARDAMPNGGKLIIETANVELDDTYIRMHPNAQPGPHVMIGITDTGIGMTPDIQEKIFEPFFTTKGPEQGTGLGLTTVYGIIKQSGGHVWLHSEPHRGTVFKIYLPTTVQMT